MFILSGCTRLEYNMDNIVDDIMNNKINYSNTVSSGYKFYKPLGVRQISDNEYNQIFAINGKNVYLYVDIISYYYKNILNYEDNSNYDYYYKKFNYNNIDGYLGINKIDSDYFVKMVYNYSKIEFYTDYYNMNTIVANSLIILNSIKYNDNLIERLLGSSNSEKMDINYQLSGPSDNGSTFSKYLEEYVPNDNEDVSIELPTDE